MARDTLGLLDALELERSQILGLSMGGMIAQELAIAYPDRIDGLVLACTHPGGRKQIRPTPGVEELFKERIPDARLKVVPGGGHQILVERSKACNEAILAFFSEIDG